MEQGIIKKLVRDRGFGFITRDGQAEGEKDVFFHSDKVEGGVFDSLNEGDKVSFEIEQGEKGPAAVNVKRV